MPLITFQPSGKTIDVEPGTELLDVARILELKIDSPCGGKGTCGKCMVRIISGNVDSDSLGVLEKDEVAEGYVLACKSKVSTMPIVIEISEQIETTGGKFIENTEESFLIKSDLFPDKWEFEPLTIKWFLKIPEPEFGDGLSDFDRLTSAIQKERGKKQLFSPLAVIQKIPDVLRKENGKITATIIQENENIHIVSLEVGDTTLNHYGIAIDIGTTTIAVELVQLHAAKTMGICTDYNDQIECGLDVISRINYASKPDRLKELRERVLKTVNSLIRQVSGDKNIRAKEISTAVISGNTTMIHLLLGLNSEYIRLEPYVPTVYQVPYLTASEIGIDINPSSWIYMSPAVGSYVGGDITAGVLCTDLVLDTEEVNLFIDIGTNGEIVVGNKDFFMTCACSAWPAFEGGGIECGMRASIGAIEKVEIDSETGKPEYTTIGNVKPKGICGSGMISLLANLFLTGWIDAAGKFKRTKPSQYIKIDGRRAYYILASQEESSLNKPIIISELDIDNIIRAKAAIYSACTLLMEHLEMNFADLSNIYIVGGFGRFLDIEKATILGMIPDIPKEKYHYIGNSSLMGSYMILVSKEYKEHQIEIAKRMTCIDLSSMHNYMDHYSGALFLPHTDLNYFPSVKKIFSK